MTTASTTSVLSHTSDATFRAWGLSISDLMTAAGFIKSADTGQIDWATVARPGVSTYAGYEIRYLNDSLHGSKPIYVKLEFGTASSATYPAIRATCASGTNGAGTLSGTTYFTVLGLSVVSGPAGTTVPSFVCATEGFVGIAAFRRGWTNYSFTFMIARTTDAAGTPTTEGFIFYTSASGALVRYMYYNGTQSAAASDYCLIPGAVVSTLISGNPQVFRHYAMLPDIRCTPAVVSFYGSEITTETTFTVRPIGVTDRTYLALSDAGGPNSCALGGASPSANRLGMLWE